jgi:hypothetical protein
MVAEGLLRAAIAFNIPAVKNIELYADYSSDDDYWKLQYQWTKKYRPVSPQRIHPILGWTQDHVTPQNRLGLAKDTLEKLIFDGRKKILFYGNSYVAPSPDPENQISKYLGKQILNADVVNLGVAGYGTDQIFLMFKETYSKVKSPLILVGIFMEDVDRSVLSVRTSQKPFFINDENGELILQGVPVSADPDAFFKENPPKIKSYFWRLLRRKFFGFILKKKENEKQILKKEINASLIKKTKKLCDERQLPLTYVLFYHWPGLETVSWEESFLKKELSRMGIPYIDTKSVLRDYALKHNLNVKAFYDEKYSGHHNRLANKIISDAILDYLRHVGYE